MTRALALALLLLAAAAPPAAAAPAAAAPPAMTREQAAAALSVLENPATRDALIAALRAVAEGPPAASHAPSAAGKPAPPAHPAPAAAGTPAPAVPLKPNSLGAQVLVGLAGRLEAASLAISGAIRTIISFPLLAVWISSVLHDRYLHQMLLAVAWRLAVVAAAGLAAERLAIRALARRSGRPRSPRSPGPAPRSPRSPAAATASPRPSPGAAEGEARAEAGETEDRRGHQAARHLRRAWLAVLSFLLDLVPVVRLRRRRQRASRRRPRRQRDRQARDPRRRQRLCRRAGPALRHADADGCRLPIAPAPAGERQHGALRDALVAAHRRRQRLRLHRRRGRPPLRPLPEPPSCLREAGGARGPPLPGGDRAAAAPRGEGASRAPEGARGPVAALRNALAAYWHYLAIFYLLALWVVWAIGVPNGFATLLRFASPPSW